MVPVMEMATFEEIPGANMIEIPIGTDGDFATLIVFEEREVGDYEIRVYPDDEATLSDTYSILTLSRWRKSASWQPLEQQPPKLVSLAEDVPVAEILEESSGSDVRAIVTKYVIQSSDPSVLHPPHAEVRDSYRVREGASIEFDAGGSDDPDEDSLTYRWDFEDDEIWDTESSSNPTESHIWLDDWIGTVRVEASDGTFADTSTASVTIYNVAPKVIAGSNQLAAPGDEVYFSGSFTDPGVLDTHTIEWNFGDGTTETNTLTPTHAYSEARKYTVTLTVIDDDGGVGIDTLTVNTGVEVSIDPLRVWVPSEENTTYNVLIQNLAKTKEIYNLNISGLDATWYSLSKDSVTLGAGKTKSVTLTVTPPYTASTNSHEFTVVATSNTDPTILGIADAEVIVTPLDVEFIDPLDVVVDVGSIHYSGEMAEFYILVSYRGEPIWANISAILRGRGGTWSEDLSEYVEPLGIGLYRVPYTIPANAPLGTYVLVVEASYLTTNGAYLRVFLLREQEDTSSSTMLVAGLALGAVAIATGYYLYTRKRQGLSIITRALSLDM